MGMIGFWWSGDCSSESLVKPFFRSKTCVTGWWFQIFFMFTPTWGRFSFWLLTNNIFWMGWNHQPDKIYSNNKQRTIAIYSGSVWFWKVVFGFITWKGAFCFGSRCSSSFQADDADGYLDFQVKQWERRVSSRRVTVMALVTSEPNNGGSWRFGPWKFRCVGVALLKAVWRYCWWQQVSTFIHDLQGLGYIPGG